jgi:hypothetical protein
MWKRGTLLSEIVNVNTNEVIAFYNSRVYNLGCTRYLGWERKRGNSGNINILIKNGKLERKNILYIY